VREMATGSKLEQLRDVVLGNGRGRQVEVSPTGEILTNGETQAEGNNQAQDPQPRPAKMDKQIFGL